MNDETPCSHCGVRFGDKTAGCDACNPHNIEAARQRILRTIPYLRQAMKKAKDAAGESGLAEIGILAVAADGSGGQVVARFAAAEFFDDLALVINAPPETAESQMAADVLELFSLMGAPIQPL